MKLILRDFFWLILLAAIVTMWWMDRSRLAEELSVFTNPSIQIQGPILIDPFPAEELAEYSAPAISPPAAAANQDEPFGSPAGAPLPPK